MFTDNPQFDDKFTRLQVMNLLENIPLGYRTENDHALLEQFVNRAQAYFSKFNPDWIDPNN